MSPAIITSLILFLFVAGRNGVRANWLCLCLEQRISAENEISKYGKIGTEVVGPTSAEKCCKSSHLTTKQQAICLGSPSVLQADNSGAKLATEECQHQFRSAMWICTVNPENPENIFGGVMEVNSREAAFIYAISAANIAYSVTKGCSKGAITCDNRVRTKHPDHSQWGGCREDIKKAAELEVKMQLRKEKRKEEEEKEKAEKENYWKYWENAPGRGGNRGRRGSRGGRRDRARGYNYRPF